MLKHRVSFLAIVMALALPALGHPQTSSAGKPEQQVLQAEKDRFAAMQKVDETALNKLLSDDLTYVHTSALLQTKKEFIDSLKSGAIKYVSMTPTEADWKVRIIGNVAIVNGAAAVHVVDHGTDLNFKLRYTTVHTNRSGSWQLLAWEATRFPATP
jgi:ketosteroid isomerase-like protein